MSANDPDDLEGRVRPFEVLKPHGLKYLKSGERCTLDAESGASVTDVTESFGLEGYRAPGAIYLPRYRREGLVVPKKDFLLLQAVGGRTPNFLWQLAPEVNEQVQYEQPGTLIIVSGLLVDELIERASGHLETGITRTLGYYVRIHPGQRVIIGSAQGSTFYNLLEEAPGVSRDHVYVECSSEAQIEVKDCGSTNGTYIWPE